MEVLNTISHTRSAGYPNPYPVYTLPSSKTSFRSFCFMFLSPFIPGVICPIRNG